MSTPFRRFEVLLPLRFNEGRPAPDSLMAQTLLELREKFGAVSCENQSIQGQWLHQGEVYRDDLVRVFVDVEDTAEARAFFQEFKQRLKGRFEQLEIWITSHPIDVL